MWHRYQISTHIHECVAFFVLWDEYVSFPGLSFEHESNTLEKGRRDDQEDSISLSSEFDTWEVESNSSFVSCEDQRLCSDFLFEGPDGDLDALLVFFEGFAWLILHRLRIISFKGTKLI